MGRNMFQQSAIVMLVSTIIGFGYGEELIGCKYQSNLCTETETCIDDDVFGQCQSQPYDLFRYQLSPEEFQLIRLELERLVLLDQEWDAVGVQCALRYFMLVVRYGLKYDVNFCNVRRPENVLRLLQTVSHDLNQKNIQNADDLDSSSTTIDENDPIVDNVIEKLVEESSIRSLDRNHRLRETNDDGINDDDYDSSTFALNQNEEKVLNHLIWQVMNGEKPDLDQLSDGQMDKFIVYVELLEKLLDENDVDDDGLTQGEIGPGDDSIVSKKDADGLEKFLYKKDEEKLGILDQGTGNKEHKIQTRYPPNVTPSPKNGKNDLGFKHTLKRIQGNRVYVRLNKNVTVDDLHYLEILSDYLDKNIAQPNNLTFNDYRLSSPNEVSFEVHSVEEYAPDWLRRVFMMPPPKPVDASVVAEQTYYLMKKVPSLSRDAPIEIKESGVGSGKNSVPVARSISEDDDNFVLPTLIVCGLVIGTLIVVLGLYAYRSRARAKAALHLLAADLEGKPSKDYQELCRQRMSGKADERLESMTATGGIVGTLAQRLTSQSEPSPPAQTHSARSSTSSWSEEPVQTNMDISTGHTILTYMEDHLLNKDRLEQEWSNLEGYQADASSTTVADLIENESKNRYQDVLPYDSSRVVLSQASNLQNSTYINASFICDHDPRNPSYIASQGPLHETTADFWQMVWEQGSVVIVNLTKLTENGEPKCVRYWPENGSEVYHIYEVHLVSEHIWCTDYLVRSFYLKNLRTQETRTVTQFHFLTWPEDGLPASTKALLDFRRKVNKSYRGRSCPIVLHCSDGSGRSGTYILLDMVLNRINKGVKEIDIAATLEHLRDQRMKFVKTVEQFEFVLTCVAEEVQAILKALPQ